MELQKKTVTARTVHTIHRCRMAITGLKKENSNRPHGAMYWYWCRAVTELE